MENKGIEGACVECPACGGYRGELVDWDKEHKLAFIKCDCNCLYVIEVVIEEEDELYKGM